MIIPETALAHALALLIAMQRMQNPTEAQRRFIGTLKKAQGLVSNNERNRKQR